MQIIETALGSYPLQRLPVSSKGKDPLRAWDAADEYLLNYLNEQALPSANDKPILLINDAFGALAVSLHQHTIHSWSDSLVAHQATLNNLNLNQIESDYQAIPSTTSLNHHYNLVLIKIPKTLALLEYQLIQLKPHINPQCTIIAAGMAKHIHTSTLKCFEKIIGTTSTSLARKKARLIFACNDQTALSGKQAALSRRQEPVTPSYPKSFTDDALNLSLSNHANVFSKDHLDIGARFMIQQLEKHLPEKPYKQVIDLGCGNGVLGIIAKRLLTDSKISFVDESYMAIDSAKTNYLVNIPSDPDLKDARFHSSNCLEQISHKADLILCNPPFHQAHSIGDQIAWQMFKQSKLHLNAGGELWVIGNRHLSYHIKLMKLFGNCRTLASNKKFVVLLAKSLSELTV